MKEITRRTFVQCLAFSAALSRGARNVSGVTVPDARRPSITDVEGVLVGHHTLAARPTGCTVITSASSFSAGVDVRGGAPGTRETDLLRAENSVESVNAIVLSGGSAFGLDSASGVMKYLEEKGLGFDVQIAKIPIVCGAILFDLRLGDPKIRPDSEAGYKAALAAGSQPAEEGNVGAGAGATVGKLAGMENAMKAGTGTWSIRRPDGLTIGALAAVNCVGDVVDPSSGKVVAGARKPDGSGFLRVADLMRFDHRPWSAARENTVLAAVATNARLSKAQCNKVAQMAQDALGRCIYPAHTPWDGDTVFSIATGRWNAGSDRPDVGLIGALAADALSTAIVRAATQADPWGPYPSAKTFPK